MVFSPTSRVPILRAIRVNLLLPIFVLLLMLPVACKTTSATLDEPFASLLPHCDAIPYASQLKYEYSHRVVVQNGAGLTYHVNERACQGPGFEAVMAISEFGTESDAQADVRFVPKSDTDHYINDIRNLVQPRLPVDELSAFGVMDTSSFTADAAKLKKNEGLSQTNVQFRRGRYVGWYLLSAVGEVVIDPFGDPIVSGDTHVSLLAQLVDDTLQRWNLQ
jgi:hypothetical protein